MSTCEFFTNCENHGNNLNPKNFTFGKDIVNFADFEITQDHVHSSERFLNVITDFPTPVDITGIRSWFGLVNQVPYAYSLTMELQPFRELLKPKN